MQAQFCWCGYLLFKHLCMVLIYYLGILAILMWHQYCITHILLILWFALKFDMKYNIFDVKYNIFDVCLKAF